MNTRSLPWSMIILLPILLAACQSRGFAPDENLAVTGRVSPEDNQPITMEDGAAIILPGSAFEGEVEVRVERNPGKELPDFSGAAVALGNFYEFTIVEGEVEGKVTLILPFDPSLIPDSEGELVVAFPSGDGWTFTPGIRDGDTVRITTDQYADPLIAWHFDRNLGVVYCDFDAAFDFTMDDGIFSVTGTLYKTTLDNKGVWVNSSIQPNRPIVINLIQGSYQFDSSSRYFNSRTDAEGKFEFQIQGSEVESGEYDIILVGSCPEKFHQEIQEGTFLGVWWHVDLPAPEGPAGECTGSSCKTIRLENYSGATDTFTLVGPETYTFPFGPGVSTHSIVYGEYEFSYTSCDGKWTSTGHLYADEVWDFSGPPDCDD